MKKEFSVYLENKKYNTRYRTEFITITKDVEEIIKKSNSTVMGYHEYWGMLLI
jgi:thiamine phosphate synthase YjbQ (UPF0047 family)